MKWPLCVLLVVCTAGAGLSCTVGETLDQLIAEKGRPVNHVEAGALQILSYPDATIKLKDNVVVSIKAPELSLPAGGGYVAPRPSTPRVAAPAAAAAAEAPRGPMSWGTDFYSALGQAKSEKKHTLLFFTGSDWCGWCKKLNHEILSTGEFAEYAQEKLVLVEVDYPQHKAQSDGLKTQNRMLEGRYNITGFPTVIILDSDGKAVARMGYQEGGPGPFVSQIRALGD
jgi:thiol-disulfide isomerase/thioredoxin